MEDGDISDDGMDLERNWETKRETVRQGHGSWKRIQRLEKNKSHKGQVQHLHCAERRDSEKDNEDCSRCNGNEYSSNDDSEKEIEQSESDSSNSRDSSSSDSDSSSPYNK